MHNPIMPEEIQAIYDDARLIQSYVARSKEIFKERNIPTPSIKSLMERSLYISNKLRRTIKFPTKLLDLALNLKEGTEEFHTSLHQGIYTNVHSAQDQFNISLLPRYNAFAEECARAFHHLGLQSPITTIHPVH